MFVSISDEDDLGEKPKIYLKGSFLLNEIDTISLNTTILLLSCATEFMDYIICKENNEEMISLLSKIYSKLQLKYEFGISSSTLYSCFKNNIPKFKLFDSNNIISVMETFLLILHQKTINISKEDFELLISPRGNLIEKSSKQVWNDYLKKHDSIISTLFHIQIQSKESCLNCQKNYVSYFHLSHISLTYLDENLKNLNSKMNSFLNSFPIKFNQSCSKCNSILNGKRNLKFSKLPKYLFIFQNLKKINFPLELNLTQFYFNKINQENNDIITCCEYELIGFIVKDKLYYTTVIKTKQFNSWLHYKDNIIEKLDTQSIQFDSLKNQSIIFLYKKKSKSLKFMNNQLMNYLYQSKYSDVYFK
eukprot:gene1613-12738_t